MKNNSLNCITDENQLKIAILAAGAAGMYCGSCLRDNTLAGALQQLGHEVQLLPLFTPLRTDQADNSTCPVFFGGVNVFLQQASTLFRHTPRAVDWLLDRPSLLDFLGRFSSNVTPESLGKTTLSILQGSQGKQQKELRRLVKYLRKNFSAEVVSLPNAMFLGLAETLKNELRVTVVCELTGEDAFLHALPEPYRSESLALIQKSALHVDTFLATSNYYADHAAEVLSLPREKVSVAGVGIDAEDLFALEVKREERPPTVGFLARLSKEKGLDQLLTAMLSLRNKPAMQDARLILGGWRGGAESNYLAEQLARVDGDWCEDRGELDRHAKCELLRDVDLLCVPTNEPDAKGLYLLESWAAGVPFVGYAHGSLPEIFEATEGGVLVAPQETEALADALAELLSNHERLAQFGQAGRDAVRQKYTAETLAQRFLTLVKS